MLPDKEHEIPIVNNNEIIPILMVVIVKSKLQHFYSNLCFIKSFYYKIENDRINSDIIKAFEQAANNLEEVNLETAISGRIKRDLDLKEFMEMTGEEYCENHVNKTLVDEENCRILNLIKRSTSEDQLC